jgi:hypothetical protein
MSKSKNKAKSADLIMKLYDLRREPVMRQARNWMIGYFPESVDDIMRTMIDPDTSAYYRMVMSYWDMAASFVNHGAVDEEMFRDASGEPVVFFSKIQPHLAGIRETLGSPTYLKHLEDYVMRIPEAEKLLAETREHMKRWMAARDEMAKSQSGGA